MKKKLSLILSAIMLITTIFSGSALAAFTDVGDDHDYKEAITTLSKLSIINGYEDGSFKPEGGITRAEFAKIVTCTMGYQNIASNENKFTDVTDHWAKQYINMCADLGIINGMGDGTFAPDAQVTFEQALKMLVCALGYGTYAENAGGYPEGYKNQAKDLDLLKKISGAPFTDPAPRGVVAQAVFNALEVEMLEKDVLGNLNATEKTLLNDYLKVKKVEGTLAAVEEYTTSMHPGVLGKGEMVVVETKTDDQYVIDYRTYTDDVTQINKYLGKAITVYYSQPKANDDRNLVIIDDETTKNEVYSVKASDIYSFNNSKLEYYTSGAKTKTLKFSTEDLSVRYNGKLVERNAESSLEKWLDPEDEDFIYGDVELTDNEADGDINLIEIMDYEIYVALKSPTSTDYRVQDKLKTARSIYLDPQAPDYTFTLTKNGNKIEPTSIAANDVILCAESLDGELKTVYVTNKTVKGEVKSINDEGLEIQIGDDTYLLGQTCIDYLANVEGKTLKVGTSGTFYLDKFDTVVFGVTSVENAIPYGYIVSAGYEEGEAMGYITAFIPSKNGSSAGTYKMAEKVKFNGQTMKSSQVVEELADTADYSNQDAENPSLVYGSDTPVINSTSQVARIELNGSNQITEIITLTSDDVDKNENTEKIVRGCDLGKYSFSGSSFKDGTATKFSTNSSTVVMYIPMNRNDKDDYAKKSMSAFNSNYKYCVAAYDVNSSNIAGLVIYYQKDSASLTAVTNTMSYSVVAKNIGSIYNEEKDENTHLLTVFKGATNKEAEWKTKDTSEFADVTVGDIIHFAYDSDKLAQDKKDRILFNDIAEVLDDKDADTLYDWTDDSKFNFIYDSKTYDHNKLGDVPYSRAFVANVSLVIPEENKIYVVRNGFEEKDGEMVLDDSAYEEVLISSSTKIVRMESNRKGFSPYAEDTSTELTYTDLMDAKNYGPDCSKIGICTIKGDTQLIVIYE